MRSIRYVVYEHDRLVVGAQPPSGGPDFTEEHFDLLARYQERTGSPAFRIGRKSLQLSHHVGYLRVGPVSLEIYPKLGAHRPDEDWRGLLLEMLRVVAGVRVAAQDQAPLRARAGDLFDLLVRRFLDLTERLLREGLARSYREVEENGTAFRGRLIVGSHLRANHVRQERLFVAYEVHDADHLPNRMLWHALARVRRTAPSSDLVSRAEGALVEFPEVSTTPIRASDWDRLRLDRSTERYREVLNIARMILLDERPDLRWGDREVIALLFDMNALFESYLEQAFRGVPGIKVKAQATKVFWRPDRGGARIVKPDLLVYEATGSRPVVVDAKWKVPDRGRPSDGDLRQLFAYLHAFGGDRGVLVYPRASDEQVPAAGRFLDGSLTGSIAFVDLFHAGKPRVADLRAALPEALTLGVGANTSRAVSDSGTSPVISGGGAA